MDKLSEKQKIIIIGAIVLFIMLIYIFLQFKSNNDIVIENDIEESFNEADATNILDERETVLESEAHENTIIEEPKKIVVYICGQVKNPGVFELDENSRVNDVIQKAGGYLEQADIAAINFARKITDGEKIYLPKIGEVVQESVSTAESSYSNVSSTVNSLVNINTCSTNDLDKLPGIGPSTANKIIEYRKKNGPFKSIDQLKKVSGIGDSKFNEIKKYVTI